MSMQEIDELNKKLDRMIKILEEQTILLDGNVRTLINVSDKLHLITDGFVRLPPIIQEMIKRYK